MTDTVWTFHLNHTYSVDYSIIVLPIYYVPVSNDIDSFRTENKIIIMYYSLSAHTLYWYLLIRDDVDDDDGGDNVCVCVCVCLSL